MAQSRIDCADFGQVAMTSSMQGRAADPASRLAPAACTSRYVCAGALRLHYLDYGTAEKPPVLCVHGSAANAHWFDFVAAGLQPDFHVRALDLRGHGDSGWSAASEYAYRDYVDDLAQVVAALALERFILIGHSMGGMVSLLYAASHPGSLHKLVIVDTTMRMMADRIANFHTIGVREGTRYASEDEYLQRYRLRPAGAHAAPEVLAHIARHAGRQEDDGSWRHKFDRKVYATREPMEVVSCWDRIRVPALLVKGALSPRVSAQIIDEVRSRAPQVEVAEVPGADHHVTLDNPHGFIEAVRGFLLRA
jgi:pimeloyl-ACP methyl ester carboxylesterase